MTTTIRIKRSIIPSKTPVAEDLEVGELAINAADVALFAKNTDGNIVAINDWITY